MIDKTSKFHVSNVYFINIIQKSSIRFLLLELLSYRSIGIEEGGIENRFSTLGLLLLLSEWKATRLLLLGRKALLLLKAETLGRRALLEALLRVKSLTLGDLLLGWETPRDLLLGWDSLGLSELRGNACLLNPWVLLRLLELRGNAGLLNPWILLGLLELRGDSTLLESGILLECSLLLLESLLLLHLLEDRGK